LAANIGVLDRDPENQRDEHNDQGVLDQALAVLFNP
jgi:hypothetical protein